MNKVNDTDGIKKADKSKCLSFQDFKDMMEFYVIGSLYLDGKKSLSDSDKHIWFYTCDTIEFDLKLFGRICHVKLSYDEDGWKPAK